MHLSLNNSLGKWILPKEPSPFSPEATNYFSRLDAAGDTTYVDYKQPLANYIDSLVSLGGAYWDDMLTSASFVGVGIQGITVPLRDGMTALTNNNFVAGDLNQLIGLKGDGSTKYLDTGYIDSDLAQNNGSLSVYVDTPSSINGTFYAGTTSAGNTGTFLRRRVTNPQLNVHGFLVDVGTAIIDGLVGVSRTSSTSVNARTNQTNYSFTDTSTTPTSDALQIFARQSTSISDPRLATYHAGPALNLATLEGLQETLLSEIRTAHTFVAAASYFSRLAAAGDTTHVAYKQPLTNYITSLVELGGAYWDDMKSAASFVGVGIQGVTVPLRDGMTVPTQNNFVEGDLNQLTGLKGDASTKYLSTGVNEGSLSINDSSISVYLTTDRDVTITSSYIGGTIGVFAIVDNATGFRSRHMSSSLKTNGTSTAVGGIIGISRDNSSDYDWRDVDANGTNIDPSTAQGNSDVEVFASNGGNFLCSARLATYHAGPALDLATLEGLQDTLLAEIAGIGFSTEAANYFSRLAIAGDTTFLAYRQPLANYIDSLVALGGAYWDTMESSASFVGVGIQGVTVPLRDGMTVPTNNNFVAGDLDTLTGLKGDASTKNIDMNILSNDIAQNDGSLSTYQTEAVTSGNYTAGSGYNGGVGGGIFIRDLGSTIQCAVHGGLVSNGTGWVSGLVGGSRSSSTTQTQRTNQTDYPFSSTSLAPTTDPMRVFMAGSSPKTDPRLATYHAGPALNLATLEGLQDTLITEIAAI